MITSLFYPHHTKGERVRIKTGKYEGLEGIIKLDSTGNTQTYFYVLLDNGVTIQRHAKNIQIIN